MRQPWNVFIYLYRNNGSGYQFLLLKRKDDGVWQGVAGGGEEGETPETAACREVYEETGVRLIKSLELLDTLSYMEKTLFSDHMDWDKDIYVIPMNYFATEYNGEIKISNEHTEYRWCSYEDAMEKLYWHDNETALWELNEKLKYR